MNLIIEKGFINSIFETSDEKCAIKNDLIQFISSDCSGYHLICDISSESEYRELSSSNPIFELMMDKFIDITFCPDLHNKLRSDLLYENAKPQSIFFTTLTNKVAHKLMLESGYIFVSMEDVKPGWKIPYRFRRGIQYKVTQSASVKDDIRIDNWEKIKQYSHPLNSMLIFDKYLFKNTSPNEINLNILPLIKNIINNDSPKTRITITIFSEIKTGFTLKSYIQKLEENLNKNIKINIVRHLKALYPRDLEGFHARFIVTNYIQLISDSGFNLFKRNGTVNTVGNLMAGFNFCGASYESFKKDCNDLNKYLSMLKNEPNGDEKYKDVYYPNKTNPLLN